MRVWQVGPCRKQIMLLVLLVLEHCWAPARLDPNCLQSPTMPSQQEGLMHATNQIDYSHHPRTFAPVRFLYSRPFEGQEVNSVDVSLLTGNRKEHFFLYIFLSSFVPFKYLFVIFVKSFIFLSFFFYLCIFCLLSLFILFYFFKFKPF